MILVLLFLVSAIMIEDNLCILQEHEGKHIYSKYSFSEAISIAWETEKSKSIESAVGLGSIDSKSPWILHSCPCCAESKVHRKPESSAFYKEPKDKNAFKEEN